MVEKKTRLYLAKDGNWGEADGMLRFWADELPTELYELLQEDPEGAYDDIALWLVKEGKL